MKSVSLFFLQFKMDPENVTNAEMENQFRERNSHLKNDMNSIVNSVSGWKVSFWFMSHSV